MADSSGAVGPARPPSRPLGRLTVGEIAGSLGDLGTFLPVCHGSGRLAAQYGFGARSGTSVVFLGGAKILVGLLFVSPAVGLLTHFPRPLLGAWIIAAAIELLRRLDPPHRVRAQMTKEIQSCRKTGKSPPKQR
jgi:hypothetical protein